MSLSHRDQVQLLKDILTNHLEDSGGSVSECEQIGRLIKALLVNEEISTSMHPMLMEVYDYCQSGKNTANLDQHINTHQEAISQWVNDINIYS